MASSTERKLEQSARLELSLPTKSQEPKTETELTDWIMQQLTILELVFNENLTPEMKRIYAHDLADLEDSLAKAFDRARCELKFFPKIAELRELAGVSAAVREEHDDVEARAAYQLVIHSLERNGVDAGIKHLPERV